MLALRLCSTLTQKLIQLSKGDDDGSIVVTVAMLLKLMSFQSQEDRHRQVITQRLEDVMAKGVIQKHEAMCEAIKKLIESKDSLDKVLNDANFA